MICNKCGKDIPEDSKFCIYCGSNDIKKEYSKKQKEAIYNAASNIKLKVIAIILNLKFTPKIPTYNSDTLENNSTFEDNNKISLGKFVLDININKDKSMDIIEVWNCNNLKGIKKLYKTFIIDNKKFKNISNVKVSQIIENGKTLIFEENDEWKNHLNKRTFFAGINHDGDYEISWRIAEKSDKGTYIISYTVNDVIAVYNDCAELYWPFIGNGFALPVDTVIGTIKLPADLINKEDIKVWGHTKSLNGEIHITSLNSVEFQVNKCKPYNYVEVRLAMPTYLFEDDESKININKLENIVEEESNWARAN